LFFLDEIVPKELIWVIESSQSREILGLTSLTSHNDAGNIELGYWIGRQFWGYGFATEAANVVLDYAFDVAFIAVVTAGCFFDNFRSMRVLRKLGFQVTGESPRLCLAEGRELPHYDMTITRERRSRNLSSV
jgi:RimJ/RimL family protein N-acetyltransferase